MYFLNLYKLVNQQNAEEVECSSDRKVIFFLYSLLLQRVENLKFRILLSGSTSRNPKISNSSQWLNRQTAHPIENEQNAESLTYRLLIPSKHFVTFCHLFVNQNVTKRVSGLPKK